MTKAMNSEALRFCSGNGQYHSENNSVDPQPYLDISLPEVEAMVLNPQRVPKPEAPWIIFSTEKTRIHAEQRENSSFGAAWFDIDENPLGLDHVVKTIRSILPGKRFLAYLTKSATPENQKCRVIIEYAHLCPGQDHELAQQVLNDRLEAAGIKPDRKAEQAGQICYLPNCGEHYDYHLEQGEPLDVIKDLGNDLEAKQTLRIEEEQRRRRQREEARRKAAERLAAGIESPIDAYNAANPIEDVLERYRYKKIRGRYLSPNSSSGTPGVSIKEDGKWVSSHNSDEATVGRSGDAFDLFCYYEHHGNSDAAIKAAARMYCQSGSSSAGVEFGPEFFEGKRQEPPFPDDDDYQGPTGDTGPEQGTKPGHSTPPSRDELSITDSELATANLTPTCFVEEYLYADVANLSAPGGTGKTTLVLYEAICIALGRPVHGMKVMKPGWTLIITAEDQRERLVARLREIMNSMDLTNDERKTVMRGVLPWDVTGEQ